MNEKKNTQKKTRKHYSYSNQIMYESIYIILKINAIGTSDYC